MIEKEEICINPVGLVNLSRYQLIKGYKHYKKTKLYNSCYINASIQCLFRFDRFVNEIMKYDKNKGNLLIATKDLIHRMQTPKNNNKQQCSVLDIKKAMGEKYEKYIDDNQEDANEFISNYLNGLIEQTQDNIEINWKCKKSDEEIFKKFYQKFIKKKGTSFILDLFYGVNRTESYCPKCNHTFAIKFNSFNILELPVTKKEFSNWNNKQIDMRDILKNFISEKEKENDRCPECNSDIKMRTNIHSLPKCLIIYFNKNYSEDEINIFDVPKTFNFQNFIYDKSFNKENNYIYDLKGIIFYSKYSSESGHYKSACLGNDKKWYYFDDNHIEVDKNLLRIYQDDNPTFLFYEK